MLSNTVVKLCAVFLFATPAVLVGGEVYSILTGSTPLEGFLKIYSVLYIIPGASVWCTVSDLFLISNIIDFSDTPIAAEYIILRLDSSLSCDVCTSLTIA